MQSSGERSRLRTDPSLSFEPLSTSFSETAISCSESDTDEVSRAAKRRRIERLARDYLDGKPLFILTARLKGPFDGRWVNPWNKAKRYRTLETPDSNTRQTDIHQKTPLAITHESVAQKNRSRNELTEKGGISTFRRQRSRNEVPETPGYSFISNNPKNTVVSGEWLKRNGKFWDRRLLECARSPSPSPINRSNSISLAPQQSSLLNEGSYLEGERSVLNPGEKLTTKPLLPEGPLVQSSKLSNTELCQPLKHKKKKKKQRNRRQLIRTESPYSVSAPSSESHSRSHGGTPSLNRKISLTPPAATRSFQRHHIYDAIEAPKSTLLTEEPAQGSSKSIHILEEQTGTPSKKKPIKLRLNTSFKTTSYGPNGRHNRSSVTTTITNFPSAQIVPGQTTFHNQISLHSTQCPVSHNTRFSPAVDGAKSTQISVGAVQQQFQEQRPNNPSTADILCSHYHDNASNDVHAAQDSGCIQDISDNPISNTPCTVDPVQFPPEFISESNHISEATVMEIGSRKPSAEVVPPKDIIMDCRRSSSTLAEYDALQSSSPVESSPRKSPGTDLALTLAASTATTKHQDGQGFIGFDNFDLDQAIADAGSFLQSWELYADISFQTTRTIPS
ncbi:hypothetical protein LOZ57_002470 [Ophidiomyces ophidiicola]|uniref:uncharacterized protein n=1 Tax=Ophidiomyces ophidiicola TaxID=1387563 RepID=UPI0020C52A6D|nr:uncharacterized protein LOZ57_002470 [Ophidiomyces ophidiicola]KAI1949103.1 hypothetical protein LOZ57_002470 [Ophidiomyces ophidiicola]KAI2055363.1 hypothetical protein LOZ43_003750 [Ophidiomyces ophidiicola]